MAEAGRHVTYSGTFTYERGGVLKSFKIYHSVRDGKEYERLVHMNGPHAEVVRQGSSLDCKRAGDVLLRGAIIESGIGRGRLEDSYELRVKGTDRVAGRLVTELLVVPKDQFRYGYALYIDKETSLLLRAMLISSGRNKTVMERFEFVELQLGDEAVEGAIEAGDVEPMVAGIDALPCIGEPQQYDVWQVEWLPAGFVLVGIQSGEEGSETLVFTDGMGFFTVFIDTGDGLKLPQMHARSGATVAAMARVSQNNRQYAVCVVGEIPMVAAKRIAKSVRPRLNNGVE